MSTRTRCGLCLTAILVPVLCGTACIRLYGPEDVRKELSREAGVQLDREMGFTVTRSGVWMARKMMKWSDEDAGFSLKGIKRVEIGIYEVRGLRDGFEQQASLYHASFTDWTPLVTIRDGSENVLILTQERDGSIRKLLVVVAEEDEWVLVRVSGKLDQVLESAIRMAFEETDRPEVYDRTREERGLPPVNDAYEQQLPWTVESADELACHGPSDSWTELAEGRTCEAPQDQESLVLPDESPVTMVWAD